MSSSEYAWGRSDRRAWRDVSPRHRCPVCNSDSWCSVHRTDPVVLCKRVENGRAHETRDGVPFWVHRLDFDAWEPEDMPPAGACVARSEPRVLDAAYRALLGGLSLSESHRMNLRARGLTDARIDANGYRTLPLEGRAALARRVTDAVGDAVRGVPGYRVAEGDGRTWASWGGAPGLLIPARDAEGRILALKIRRDDATGGDRYRYMTSRDHGGATALAVVHVPPWTGDTRTVCLTEGELKADVCTALLPVLTISIPGAAVWSKSVPVLRRLGTRRVRVALDRDAVDKPEVARALEACCVGLRGAGFAVHVVTWDDPAAKGLDDLLAARARRVA